ncbi:MAG: hypothetical protein AAFV80_22150 [Bacteroidota bacterium]
MRKTSFVQERLKQGFTNQVNQARLSLFLIAAFLIIIIFYVAIAVIGSLVLTMSQIIQLGIALAILACGLWSLSQPDQAFKVAFIPLGVLLFLAFNLMMTIVVGSTGIALFRGIQAANALKKMEGNLGSDVLDAGNL